MFTFNVVHYLQQHGTAMGIHMAPSYANLFMGELEQVLLQTQHRAPLVWWKCVDDILAISLWTHGEAALQEVLASLNQHHTTIKFTPTWSADEVTFLHTRAYKDHHTKMDLHVKPTDTRPYLQIISCCSGICTIAITYSQASTRSRMRSEQEYFIQWTAELQTHFTRRGYSE